MRKGTLAQELGEVGRSLSFWLPQSLMEQAQKEDAVELLEAPVSALIPDHAQAVAQIVEVSVEEALLLDEVDEHHAVEHQGGVPVAVALGGDAVDELPEGGQLRPKPFVESLGDLLDVQRRADAGSDQCNVQRRFFIQRNEQGLEALKQVVPILARDEGDLPASGGLAALPPNPLPHLCLAVRVDEDDQVLECQLGDLVLYLAPDRVLRDAVVDAGVTLVDDESGLLRDRP